MSKRQSISAKHRRRFHALQEFGCVACRKEGDGYRAPDVHHLVDGGKRLGHDYTIPLCPYHHRGVQAQNGEIFHGPSLADGKRKFEFRYGKELDLLDYVDRRLEALCATR